MKSQKLPITAVMVIYNEEAVLERAIKSYTDLVDEIIIVHDGPCTDKSLVIAKKYTKNVYVRKRTGFCEYHRSFTYKKAKNDWILQIDADEYLTSQLQNNLGKFINNNVDIYDFSWPGYYKKKHFDGPVKRTLFRKSKIAYYGMMHHDPAPLNDKVVAKYSPLKVMHEPGYEYLTIKKYILRHGPLAKIHARLFFEGPKKLQTFNCKNVMFSTKDNIRIRFPLIAGIIGSFFFHTANGFWHFLKTKQYYYLKQGILTGIYCGMVFYEVTKLKMGFKR